MGSTRAGAATACSVANQYVDDLLIADTGELVRLYLLDAGPNEWSAFHAIGTIFDHTWQEGVVGGPAQTVNLAPSQDAIVEFTMEEDGAFPFVTHRSATRTWEQSACLRLAMGVPANRTERRMMCARP